MRAITYICTLLGLLLCTVLLTLSSTALCILLYMLWITKKDYHFEGLPQRDNLFGDFNIILILI